MTQENIKNILSRKNAQSTVELKFLRKEKKNKFDLHYPRKLCSKKVVANADSANISLAPRRNKEVGSWEPLVVTFSSPGQYVTSLCVYV